MTMGMGTPHWNLPYLATAQSQKEMTHNEALVIIDAVMRGMVENGPLDVPPADPMAGQCWIIGDNPEDEWLDKPQNLAIFTDGGWRFVVPHNRMKFYCISTGTILCFNGNEWLLPQVISEATGGMTVDEEARAVLVELIQLLHGHGLASLA